MCFNEQIFIEIETKFAYFTNEVMFSRFFPIVIAGELNGPVQPTYHYCFPLLVTEIIQSLKEYDEAF
jgi:hypothetical protein